MKGGNCYSYNTYQIEQRCNLSCNAYAYTTFDSGTATGDVAQPIQWSSEYYDNELVLVYYNYRHYNPTDGRWINCDPIAEQGGWNLYEFVGNKLFYVDYLGKIPPYNGGTVGLTNYELDTQKEFVDLGKSPISSIEQIVPKYEDYDEIIKNVSDIIFYILPFRNVSQFFCSNSSNTIEGKRNCIKCCEIYKNLENSWWLRNYMKGLIASKMLVSTKWGAIGVGLIFGRLVHDKIIINNRVNECKKICECR